MTSTNKWAFLKSTRFWALVIAGLGVASEGNFTTDAWIRGISTIAVGFTAVRTIDRNVGDVKK